MANIDPTRESLENLKQTVPMDKPVTMLNLLRFNEQANYPPDSIHTPCSGREAYKRYSATALAKLEEIGARPVWMGRALTCVIAPDGEQWDEVFLVRYPSGEAFFQMIGMPDYQAATLHRTAALADSRLIATVEAGDKR
ncbi:MAG TPA: DUF1330 domain-containing protein [Marinobacter sp.]